MADKDRELADAHGEIKSLRLIERAKDKALTEVLVFPASSSLPGLPN